jgi:hypothetical protein
MILHVILIGTTVAARIVISSGKKINELKYHRSKFPR